MYRILKIFCALFILTCPVFAQNEIDHIATLWPSGYGKLAIDRDTLYVNTLNGHSVERYDIADPANPIFIDKEEVSGFDQIDFNRRLMAKIDSTDVWLIDFFNFANAAIVSSLPLTLPAMKNSYWKLAGNYMLAASADDSIRTYDIMNSSYPFISASIGLYRPWSPWPFMPTYSIFGSTKCLVFTPNIMNAECLDIYDISDPLDIQYDTTYAYTRPSVGGNGFMAAKGDTVVYEYSSFMGIQWVIRFLSFAQNDISDLPYWSGYGEGAWPPAGYFPGYNGFIISHPDFGNEVGSFNNFTHLGNIGNITSYNFGCTNDNYLVISDLNQIRIMQPTYSDSLMPQISSVPSHYGILSCASYGNYILSGAESNGGELLIHHLDSSNNLNLVSIVHGVPAKKIIIDSTFAICLCANKISRVDLSNPASPIINREISTLGTMVDFDKSDSLVSVINSNTFYFLRYRANIGFFILSSIAFPGASLTSVVQDGNAAFVVKGGIGNILKISSNYGANPVVQGEYRLPYTNYQSLKRFSSELWISGPSGTDIIGEQTMGNLGFFGPEYFSDVRDIRFSHDTLYVADGANGVKLFKYHRNPVDSLHFIGGYSTGNVVNQLATIGNNMFAADYYSLQHLRWGAPTAIEEHNLSNQPREFSLLQNYPNPFNSQTTISYDLASASDVTLSIYNILGERVDLINPGFQSAGAHSIIWDSKDLGSGLYFYQIKAGHTNMIRKMMLLK